MNPLKFAIRRPFLTILLVVLIAGGSFLGLSKKRAEYLDTMNKRALQVKGFVLAQYESHFHKAKVEEAHHEEHKILTTSPVAKDVTIKQDYVCQIHSQRFTEIQALEGGYLEAVPVREGQSVKKDDLMFQIKPILYQAKLEAELAEVQLALLEYNNTNRLYSAKTQAVSQNEVMLFKAKLARAEAKKKLAEAEYNFATIKAPFAGIVDRLREFEGSLIKEGDILTTLSDNTVMWVYFNVPERRYLEYMAELGQGRDSPDIELVLANHNKFDHTGKIGAIEAQFNPETGNIKFRADFPNPNGLLRYGQTGTVVISRKLMKAILIPQRATFENLAKRYVYIVDKDDVVHQREIVIQNELEDVFVIKSGVGVEDKIVLEGIRQVHDGEKVKFEFISGEKAMENPKNHAE